MRPVPKLLDVEVAFSSNPPIPTWAEIPDEFKRHHNKFNEIANLLFFKGGKLEDHGLKIRDGLDAGDVYRALRACLGSWDIKHEHKAAGVGLLLSEWCEEV